MSTKPLKICIITFPFGKAFNRPLLNLERILCSFSNNIYIIRGDVDNEMAKTSTHEVQTYIVHHKNITNLFFRIIRYVYIQVKVSSILVKLPKNIDFYIFFMEGDALLPVLITKLLRKKIFRTLPSCIAKKNAKSHGNILPLIASFLQNISYAFSDKIILYSPNLIKEWNLKKFSNKICFAHEHFIDFNIFRIKKRFDKRDNLIGYIGRLSEEKGVMNFVRSIPKLFEEQDNIKIFIGGEGKSKEKIDIFLKENNIEDKVRFVGWIPHDKLPECFNELKLVVLPSYTEGLPNIMLEAMACGTLVLATPVGAIQDIIKDGKTGFIMKNNSPECITENIIKSLECPNINVITKNARELVERKFSYNVAVERYRGILIETLER